MLSLCLSVLVAVLVFDVLLLIRLSSSELAGVTGAVLRGLVVICMSFSLIPLKVFLLNATN